jgi:hypothetical protein
VSLFASATARSRTTISIAHPPLRRFASSMAATISAKRASHFS